MAFVNEYVAVEDYKYIPYPAGDRPMWTVDRSRNIFFKAYRAANPHENPEEDGIWYNRYILSIAGKEYIIKLTQVGADNGPDGARALLAYYNRRSTKEKEGVPQEFVGVPFYMKWKLWNSEAYDSSVLDILKEALTAYGSGGVYQQIPNTIVQFTF
jgi:hypothetical protein